MARSALAELQRCHLAYGADAARSQLSLLNDLSRTPLRSAAAVRRLHEVLCVLRAYPGDAKVLAKVVSMLARFASRADLMAHRDALADSGIAGTAIHYRFFAGQAQWLATRWPDRLQLDRNDAEAQARIARALPTLLTRNEAHALAELKLAGYVALDRLRGRHETDAVFLLRRIAALPGDGFTQEAFSDGVDASFVLRPGPDTPSRTLAHFAPVPVVLRTQAPSRVRPDLRHELARAPLAVRRLSRDDGQALVELARSAMVTRARSLEAFSYANPRDAWLVDDGDGLAFALIGVIPERRHALASFYGGLTLRNGVPIGYTQVDLLGRSAALSFNTFETFRGGEAAFTFARWLAALHHVFDADSFSIEPYQLGQDNDEAIESGAWWFYAKLGFVPRDAATRRLARVETSRIARRPGRRSSAATLRRLAERHLFFDLDPACPRPWVPLGELGLLVGAWLSLRAGADRERAVQACSAELARLCGVTSWRAWTSPQREAWRRFAPIALWLGAGRWRAEERNALVALVRAKAATGERGYLQAYLAHPRLDVAMKRMS
jgi:hypothetical protein